jgi:hypothetical protein
MRGPYQPVLKEFEAKISYGKWKDFEFLSLEHKFSFCIYYTMEPLGLTPNINWKCILIISKNLTGLKIKSVIFSP